MSKTSSASKIQIKSFDDLFSENAVNKAGEIKNLPIDSLVDFDNHPFQIKLDNRFLEMVDSIKRFGVLVPGIVRPLESGKYEIIAGHTRRRAAYEAGLTEIPMLVKDLDDDEATIVMVDSNIQRENILPSEKARAYKMRYDAMKHQGVKGNSLQAMSEEMGENAKKIQRYIWLANLSDELLQMVDMGKLGFVQGVDLSFLKSKEQKIVYEVINKLQITISTGQSKELKELSQSHKFEEAGVWSILSPRTVSNKQRKVTFKSDSLDNYFPEDYSEDDITKIITELLEEWKRREV